ncbi:uncharacterized protein LOC125027184 [Penaeus chinensis]|uniref:uncharacterized protein LOC125027184 n=1 Tax=Penaeus chinensis TaxID=139456 RepID=UPI001FB5D51F|nr:uncharacterized protein LOC125027184 [Penaeus chinensis]
MAGKKALHPNLSVTDVRNFPFLKKILPPEYDYYVEAYKEYEGHEEEKRFSANFRISRSEATKDSMRRWLEKFCSHSLTTYRIERTYPTETKWFTYRVDLRCQHNTKPTSHKRVRTPHKKHTACPAKMTIKIRQDRLSRRKSSELHLKTHPVEVMLYHLHNHLTQRRYALQFRDPDSALVKKFRMMYHAGYKPATALKIHKRDIHMEYEDDSCAALEDRALCPDVNWCYRQYYLTCKGEKSLSVLESKTNSLEEFVHEYNKQCNEICAAMKLLNDENTDVIIALVTPLMKHFHKGLVQTGKLIIIDSNSIEFLKCRIYLLMTHSGFGGLPVGILITSTDSPNVLHQALDLYMDLLSDQAFAGRGNLGPEIILTEDCYVQRQALAAKFPDTTILICPYHVIQSAWECLCHSQSGIEHGSRQELFGMVKDMVLAQTDSDLEEKYKNITSLQTHYPLKFFSHMEDLYKKRNKWALCLQGNLMNQIYSFTSVAEIMESLKDKMLKQIKACTMVQLLKFLTTDLDTYYTKKLHCIAEGQFEVPYLQRYMQEKKMMDMLEVVPFFKIKNASTGECFDVDMSLGLCSCSVGVSGEPCKHQCALTQKLDVGNLLMKPEIDSRTREEIARIYSQTQDKKLRNYIVKKIEKCSEKQEKVNEKGNLELSNNTSIHCEKYAESKDASIGGIDLKKLSDIKTSADAPPCLVCNAIPTSQAHFIRCSHNVQLFCETCRMGPNNPEQEQHCLQKHTSKKQCGCGIRGKGNPGCDSLRKHALCQSPNSPYGNELCGKHVKNRNRIARHRSKKDKKCICSNCQKPYIKERHLTTQLHKTFKTFDTDTNIEVKSYPYPSDHHHKQKVIIINADEPTTPPAINDLEESGCSYVSL